jgi:hypothetical protein
LGAFRCHHHGGREIRSLLRAQIDLRFGSLNRGVIARSGETRQRLDNIGDDTARGDHKRAAECYRQVIDFIRAHPDQYEPDFEDTFHRLIAKLEPTPAS